jgi:hypothetical protein
MTPVEELMKVLESKLPDNFGYVLMVFPFGELTEAVTLAHPRVSKADASYALEKLFEVLKSEDDQRN